MARETEGKAVNSGLMLRAMQGVGATIKNVANSWFGPNEPIQVTAPEGVKGRAFQYPVGWNLNNSPRWPEEASIADLRMLARNCDLVNLAVDTRKDQLERVEWDFRLRDESIPVSQRTKDPRIDELRKFFAQPDPVQRLSFRRWMRKAMDDLMIIDSPMFNIQLNRAGKPYRIKIIDPNTIRPLINADGDSPQPPDPAFQQWFYGAPAANYSLDELYWNPRNRRSDKFFGYSPTENVWLTVNTAIRRASLVLAGYTAGTIPEAIIPLPEGWTAQQIAEFQLYWETFMEGNFQKQRQVKFVPAGVDKAIFPKKFEDKGEFDEWLARIICYAFSLPPTALVKQVNRATGEQAQETAMIEGQLPLLHYWKEVIDFFIIKYWGYTDVEFTWKLGNQTDEAVASAADTARASKGIMTIDEIRKNRGLDPMGANQLMVLTNTGYVAVPLGDAQVQQTSQPQPEEENTLEQPAAKLAKKEKKTLKMLPLVGAGKIQKHLATSTSKFLKKQGRRIAAEARKKLGKLSKEAGEDEFGFPDALDFDDWSIMVSIFEPQLVSIGKRSGMMALAQLGITEEAITDQVSDLAIKYAKERAAELVGMRYVDGELVPSANAKMAITDSTREMLRGTIKQGVEDGLSSDALGDLIEESYAFSEERADVIAQTEIAFAHVNGNMDGWRESGVVKGKQWIVSNLHDDDDECNENADQGVIGLDDDFESGDDSPPAHPRCECDILAVLDEDYDAKNSDTELEVDPSEEE